MVYIFGVIHINQPFNPYRKSSSNHILLTNVCYGEVVIYVILNDKLLIAIVRPLKHTAQSTLEIDDELKRHPVLRKFVQPKSETQTCNTHKAC